MKNSRKKYDYEQLKKEREYGFYWYNVLWSILRPILIFCISAILAIGIFSYGINILGEKFFNPVDPQDISKIKFTVKQGSSLSTVSKQLENNNIIKNRHVFKYYSDFLGLGQKIQAGEYELSKSMTLKQIANELSSGDGKSITRRITIIPGSTVEDIANQLAKERVIENAEVFLALCKDAKEFKNYYFIDDIFSKNLAGDRKYVLEGYLSPNTYEIYTNATAKDIVSKLLTQTDIVFSDIYHNRAEELNISMDEVLTLASIIEKEAKKQDFAKVSAIFHNRLRQGMKLESDVTIHYTTNIRRMHLNKEDINVNSPYNTYKIKGLPVGPICSPSSDAIYAALFPDEEFIKENYLFFCSKDPATGELHFSKTLKEHKKAVEQYAPLWDSFDKSRGL